MIFFNEAPKYWAAGLPAIPLMREDKRPAIPRWQLFADAFPTKEEQDTWLDHYAAGNIGLPMGPSSGLVAVDIDTDDPRVLQVLDRILPQSPWTRVGKKGKIMVYRFNNERTTRIKAGDGSMICEILSKGTQFVLPPSIHPDTKRPYTANGHLYEVHRSVPTLPVGVETIIRDALKEIGYDVSVGNNNKITTFVPAGARDNAMVWHAGLLARAVLRGERSLMQALGEIASWVETFVEQVVGDPVTVEKAQGKLIEFLIRDVTGERKMDLPVGWDEDLTEEDKERLGLTFTDDHEKWPAQKIIEYVAAEFNRFSDFRDPGRVAAINVALDRLARAGDMISALDEALVLRFVAAQSAGIVTQADLKRQLSTLRRGDIAGENHEELAEATLKFLGEYGEIRFDAGWFWQWKGAFWEKKEEFEVLKVIAEQFGAYPACRRQSDHQGVMRTMKAKVCFPLKRGYSAGVNFANGFLTENMQLVEHHPDHGMTYVLPYRYLPEVAGHMPMFNQFLMDSWGEDSDYGDKLSALQEAMGATLMSAAPRYQRAICLFGQPGSGKSRVTAIMRGLLPGGSVCSIPPHDWGDKFLPAQMFGKVLNFAGELSDTKNIPGEIFKQVVTGEELTAQHKNQAPFAFTPGCAHWFSSNHLPKTKDSSDGFNRRWLLLEWNRRVDPHKIIPDLDQIILEHEREAIVAWAIQGYERLIKNGAYTLPTSHMALIDQMAAENNSVRYFLTSCPRIVVGQHKVGAMSLSMTTLHGEYWNFCLATGTAQRVSVNRFAAMMKELQPTFNFRERMRPTKNGQPEIVYEGVALEHEVKA